MTDKTASLALDGKNVELPVKQGTIGPDVIDIGTLYKHTNAFTYDPGFTSTASCESKITYIDGDEGILLHRGYPIDQLAEQGDFLEVCYLLLYGELPTAAQKKDFDYRVTHHTMVHEQMSRFFTVSVAMPTRWPSCAVASGRCRPSTMTRPISPIRTSGWSPACG